ncbi:pyridoxamine 5'-phosphate oxidase family protein [Streptomyces sp. CAU 1734]|uniref:pyridoxamine 5'-phosphate oxidase family protein n=1 Tax=Streptomyces sp. CAU 1734 TaxID=3140360 RepID=UPI003260D3E3
MAGSTPRTELDKRYSEEEAAATSWEQAVERLSAAELFWLSSVRPDGRPHVTPVVAVWHEDGLHFCTGPGERKELNLRGNREVVLTTGSNTLREGWDLVVEGEAVPLTDEDRLGALSAAYVAKYGEDWKYEVRDGAFFGDGQRALVFRVEPRTAFGFTKQPYGQTRWRFTRT